MFSMNRALVGDHIPGAIGALICFVHHAMGFDCCAAHPRRFGIGMGGSGRIKMPVQRIIERADDAVGIGDRCDFPYLFRAYDFGL